MKFIEYSMKFGLILLIKINKRVMMIIRKNSKFALNFSIQMFLKIVRYTCKQFEPLTSLPGKLLTLITNPESDFYCHKHIVSKN
jgi:hypothetical protein